jgi:hypothetical protein
MIKNRARFAAHITSHRIVSSGVNSVRGTNVSSHGSSDMSGDLAVHFEVHLAAISNRHHRLVIRRAATGHVAFDGKFWSMQNNYRRSPFGLFLRKGRFPFRMGWQGPESRQEAKKTRSQKETKEETS